MKLQEFVSQPERRGSISTAPTFSLPASEHDGRVCGRGHSCHRRTAGCSHRCNPSSASRAGLAGSPAPALGVNTDILPAGSPPPETGRRGFTGAGLADLSHQLVPPDQPPVHAACGGLASSHESLTWPFKPNRVDKMFPTPLPFLSAYSPAVPQAHLRLLEVRHG